MQILCRVGTLFKLVLLASAAGVLVGFWAAQHIGSAAEPTSVSSTVSGKAGTDWWEEVNPNGDAHLPGGRAQLGPRTAGLTAGAPR